MNQTLIACGFNHPDEVRTLLERCGVTVRRPLSDAVKDERQGRRIDIEMELEYHPRPKARHMRHNRQFNLARECEEAIKEKV